MLGGAPRRLIRLSAAGASLLDRVGAGEMLSASAGRVAVLERLVRAGILHPDPVAGSGGPTADDVTVVVPVHDDPDGVDALLRSLRAAGSRPRGIVVVDDGSADPARLHRVVHDAGGDLPAELVRRDRAGGPAAARNAGIARVRTTLVALLDADCAVGAGWLEPLLAQLADPTVAIVAPRVVASRGDGSATCRARYESARSPLDLGRHSAEVRPGARLTYVPSAALLARRDVLGALGGFDEELRVGEDVDLVWRAVAGGHRVRYVPASLVEHRVRPTWSAWVRQRVGYGRSAASLDERHPGQVAPAVVSPWSLGVWLLALSGHPFAGAALGAAATATLSRSLDGLPLAEVARLGAQGHLGAGRQMARAAVRVWWPLLLVGSIVSRRVRHVAVACVAVDAASAWTDGSDRVRVEMAPWTLAAVSLADDVAYGFGVWQGCTRRRSWRALLPRVS